MTVLYLLRCVCRFLAHRVYSHDDPVCLKFGGKADIRSRECPTAHCSFCGLVDEVLDQLRLIAVRAAVVH
jgi:hypothetical protein